MQYENAHIRTSNIISTTRHSHKRLMIRREGEYLNVIMIKNDIHPWLKVV